MEMPRPDPALLARKPELLRRLQQVLPPQAVIHEEAETRAYECDALTAYKCPPMLVVLPSTTGEVSQVCALPPMLVQTAFRIPICSCPSGRYS